MAEPLIIGLWRAGGDLVAVESDGRSHSAHRFQDSRWRLWRRWSGDEITTCAVCQETLIVCEADGLIRSFGAQQETTLKSDLGWLYGAATLSDDTVLLGGERGVVGLLDLSRNEMASSSLAELGAAKPGRDILNIVTLDGQPLLLGRNRLVAAYSSSECEELTEAGPRSETRFDVYYACRADGAIWVSGLFGVAPSLGRLSDRKIVPIQSPDPGDAAPALFVSGTKLQALSDDLWTLEPASGWKREELHGREAPLAAMETLGDDAIALSENGQCFVRSSGSWREIEGMH